MSIVLKLMKLSNEFGIRTMIEYLNNKLLKNTENYISFVEKILTPYSNKALQVYGDEIDGKMPNKVPVWIFWWQGYEGMPLICKKCFESVKEHLPSNANLILVTKENYKEYVSAPNEIIEKVENGVYSITLFSDWLRNALLVNHGGFWIDSTIFCVKDIDYDFLRDNKYWSIKIPYGKVYKRSVGRTITKCMWGGFIQKSPKGFRLNRLVLYCINSYMLEHDVLIDYFLQNFFIRSFYDMDEMCSAIIDEIPVSNTNLYMLANKMNESFNEQEWNSLTENTTFFKLSWKANYKMTTDDGQQTFYSFLVNQSSIKA